METDTVLYDKNGEASCYITEGFRRTIYLWDGTPVAYLYEEEHVYGINGRHLGWFIDRVLYNHRGERIAFTFDTCPVRIAKKPVKGKKISPDEARPRWGAPPLPKLGFNVASEELTDLLREGEVPRYHEEAAQEEPLD